MTPPRLPPERPSFSTGLGIGFLLGGPAAFGSIVLQSKAWVACGVNYGPGTGISVLFLELPGLWAMNAVLFAGVLVAIADSTWRRRALGVVAGLSALLLFAWLVFAGPGTPAAEPAPAERVRDITPAHDAASQPAPAEQICPSNVPPWWPSWIPV